MNNMHIIDCDIDSYENRLFFFLNGIQNDILLFCLSIL